MKGEDYIQQAIQTESPPSEEQLSRVNLRILHALMGLQTETAELTDAVKRHIFYGTELDKVNLVEEIGDVFWYVAILMDELKLDVGDKASFEHAMKVNIEKLRARYPNKFTEHDAVNRDLNSERKILEQ